MNPDEQEARDAKLISYKQRMAWLEAKLWADTSSNHVEALSKVVRRLGWTSISVKGLAEYVKRKQKAKNTTLANRFNAVSQMTYWNVKRKYPIKAYGERYLGLVFDRNDHCKCPLHDGHTDTSFVVDEDEQRWYCFGDCPPDPGRKHRSGDVIDLHRIVKGLPDNEAALKDLLTIALDAGLVGRTPNVFFV
jgi:hypothetical protein